MLLRRDLNNIGMDLPLSKKEKAELAALQRAENHRHRDELLRSADLDPRTLRSQGRAVKSIPEIEERLRLAIQAEDYDLAALLRDELIERKGHSRAT
jgi:hypothetical protein